MTARSPSLWSQVVKFVICGFISPRTCTARSAPRLCEPLEGAEDYLRVEAWYAAAHESAHHLDDVLARRTRISIETFDRGLTSAKPVARLMAEVLGWSEQQIARGGGLRRARGRRARLPGAPRRPGRRRRAHARAGVRRARRPLARQPLANGTASCSHVAPGGGVACWTR
jgi:hypothetical protein